MSCWRKMAFPAPLVSIWRRSRSSAGSICSARPRPTPMYHAGWAWAGSTPYKGTKLLASHFGGTRKPLWLSAGRRRSSRMRPRGRSFITSTTLSRRSTRSSASPPPSHGERRRAGPDRRREFRLLFRRREEPMDGCSPNISRSWAAAPFITTVGWPASWDRGFHGFPKGCQPAFGSGRRTRTSGSFTIWTRRPGLRPTTSPQGMPEKNWRR